MVHLSLYNSEVSLHVLFQVKIYVFALNFQIRCAWNQTKYLHMWETTSKIYESCKRCLCLLYGSGDSKSCSASTLNNTYRSTLEFLKYFYTLKGTGKYPWITYTSKPVKSRLCFVLVVWSCISSYSYTINHPNITPQY